MVGWILGLWTYSEDGSALSMPNHRGHNYISPVLLEEPHDLRLKAVWHHVCNQSNPIMQEHCTSPAVDDHAKFPSGRNVVDSLWRVGILESNYTWEWFSTVFSTQTKYSKIYPPAAVRGSKCASCAVSTMSRQNLCIIKSNNVHEYDLKNKQTNKSVCLSVIVLELKPTKTVSYMPARNS